MLLTKEGINKRIQELDAVIVQQGQYVQQINNQILMCNGAKEEYLSLLKQCEEIEKAAKAEADKLAQEEAKNQDKIEDEDLGDLSA